MGKLRDLITLVIIGVVLLVAVAVDRRRRRLLRGPARLARAQPASSAGWSSCSPSLSACSPTRCSSSRCSGCSPPPTSPSARCSSGALLGAVGFEILKQASQLLIKSTEGQPAFQAFGIALILVVWINYFSRVILYAAAWAWTHPLAEAERVVDPAEPVQGPHLPSLDELPSEDEGRSRKGAFAAGAVAGAAAAAVIKGRGSSDE